MHFGYPETQFSSIQIISSSSHAITNLTLHQFRNTFCICRAKCTILQRATQQPRCRYFIYGNKNVLGIIKCTEMRTMFWSGRVCETVVWRSRSGTGISRGKILVMEFNEIARWDPIAIEKIHGEKFSGGNRRNQCCGLNCRRRKPSPRLTSNKLSRGGSTDIYT